MFNLINISDRKRCGSHGKIKSTRRSNLSFESLERREVMSVAPVVFQQISEAFQKGTSPLYGSADFGNTLATASYTPTSPMMETKVEGSLSTGSDVDVIRVRLEKGQIFTVDLDFAAQSKYSAMTATAFVGATAGSATSTAATSKLGGTANTQLAGVGTAPFSGVIPKVALFNAAGQKLAESGLNGIGYRVEASGDYYVSMAATSTSSPATYSANYTIHVRPIGLASNDLDPSWLQKDAQGIYAWQDGDRLNISGPVGHGFSIRGNWEKQTMPPSGSSIVTQYSAHHSTIYIQTGAGTEIPIDLGVSGINLKTTGGRFGNLYGEISSFSFSAMPELAEGIAEMINESTPFGLDLELPDTSIPLPEGSLSVPVGQSKGNSPVSLPEIGLRLGNDSVLALTNAPLNSAVPYLYFNGGVGITGSYKGEFAGKSLNVATVIFDPADPFVYLGSDLLAGVGVSYHGLIPFTPENEPTAYKGTLFGHVFVTGEFQVTPALNVSGDVLVNFNGGGIGQIRDSVVAAIGSVGDAIATIRDDGFASVGGHGKSIGSADDSATDSFWRDFGIGVNGTLNIVSEKIVDDLFAEGTVMDGLAPYVPNVLKLASATAIYDGSKGGFYFRGGSNSMLHGTKLEFLEVNSTNLNVDGAWEEGGRFFVDAEGKFGTLGSDISGHLVLARKFELPQELAELVNGPSPVAKSVETTGGYLKMDLRVLGSNVAMKGHISGNGDFELKGEANVNLGLTSASVKVRIGYNRSEGSFFEATLIGRYPIAPGVRAVLKVHLNLEITADRIRYSLSTKPSLTSTATIQVQEIKSVSTKGIKTEWVDKASVEVGVDDDKIWFDSSWGSGSIDLP